jgi:uncharacterized membrane protein YhhN
MSATALSGICAIAVVALVVAEFKRIAGAKVLSKSVASLAFVGVALSLAGLDSTYGQLILLALLLSLAGDVLLLSERSSAFLAGLGAFLLAHLAFATAFAVHGASLTVVAIAACLVTVVGFVVLRWLWPRLPASFRLPVIAYVIAILAMCSFALGHASSSGRWLVAAGAIVFAASDFAVAREKFVQPSLDNKAWGLPAYYSAQLMLAWSVSGALQVDA